MQLSQHQDLWNRLRDFEIDDPLASVKYSDKLARYHGWQKDYAFRVIEEYKKFIFLCYVLPQGASPSKAVDEAWHLHLTYTQNYWKGLCATVLGKELHHYPSRGDEERNKHIDWYNRTLNAYQEIFGEAAPSDIWPPERPLKINTKTDERVADRYGRFYKKYSWFFVVPFVLIALLYGKLNPFMLTGPQFLVFFISLIIAGIVYLFLIREKKEEEIRQLINDRYDDDANVYQIARFVYNGETSLRGAIIDLVERGILEPARQDNFIFKAFNYSYSASEKNPLAINLLKNVKDGETIHYTTLFNYYDYEATYHEGLSIIYRSVTTKERWPIVVAVLIAVAGLARIIQGIHNDKPVLYLIILEIVFVVIMSILVSGSYGKKILQQFFQHEYKTRANPEFAAATMVSSFVFMGLPYISGLAGRRELEKTFANQDKNSDTYSGDYGSSGCGSGGSCGGGCGGCGGGD